MELPKIINPENQQRNCVDIKTRSHYMQFVRGVKVILFSANTADLQKMGNRSTVGRRTLTPLIKVRILVPQPNKIKDLSNNCLSPFFCPVILPRSYPAFFIFLRAWKNSPQKNMQKVNPSGIHIIRPCNSMKAICVQLHRAGRKERLAFCDASSLRGDGIPQMPRRNKEITVVTSSRMRIISSGSNRLSD